MIFLSILPFNDIQSVFKKKEKKSVTQEILLFINPTDAQIIMLFLFFKFKLFNYINFLNVFEKTKCIYLMLYPKPLD